MDVPSGSLEQIKGFYVWEEIIYCLFTVFIVYIYGLCFKPQSRRTYRRTDVYRCLHVNGSGIMTIGYPLSLARRAKFCDI